MILAALNPKKGHFNHFKKAREQIQLPDTLLDRFDLTYIIQDIPNKIQDNSLVWNITGYQNETRNLIPEELLQKYISHAKRTINPEINPEGVELIADYYQELREDPDNIKIITPREVEALHRISKSIARIELKEIADKSHVKQAIEIMDGSLKTFILMPRLSNLEPQEMDVYDKT
jgi:replicative DNA helicase Mcm